MMTLTEFLLARIAEDEAVARTAEYGYIERQLAECEAKRRIVEQFAEATRDAEYDVWHAWLYAAFHLATVYADHPDYREEWKP